MFQITKTFRKGSLAGITLSEVFPFEMPLGFYAAVDGSDYEVISCEQVQD